MTSESPPLLPGGNPVDDGVEASKGEAPGSSPPPDHVPLSLIRTLTRGYPRLLNLLSVLAYLVACTVLPSPSVATFALHVLLAAVALDVLVLVLKGLARLIAPPDATWVRRPEGAVGCADLATTYNGTDVGMPSNHAALGLFYAVVLFIPVLRPNHNGIWLPRALRFGALLPLAVLSLAVPPSRLSWRCVPRSLSVCRCGCHTPLQVVVGALIGACAGCVFQKYAF